MSIAQIKQEAKALPEAERRDLSAFLIRLGRERDDAWRAEVSKRMRDMDDGKKISQDEFERKIGFMKG